jgi:hypothetical protein
LVAKVTDTTLATGEAEDAHVSRLVAGQVWVGAGPASFRIDHPVDLALTVSDLSFGVPDALAVVRYR